MYELLFSCQDLYLLLSCKSLTAFNREIAQFITEILGNLREKFDHPIILNLTFRKFISSTNMVSLNYNCLWACL